MHFYKIFVVAALFLLFGCTSEQEEPADPFQRLSGLIDQYADDIIDHGNVSTMSVAVYKNGQHYHNYFGRVDGDVQLPNDSTLFEIASITKIITGTIVAKAVLEKKVSLDDDIRDYLPGRYLNLQFNGYPVRIRHLVTHTLGFETPPGLDKVFESIFSGTYKASDHDYSMTDLLKELQAVTLEHKPGTVYDYNNVGPDIAAYILEQVYEKSYAEILQTFLNELDMHDTHLQEYNAYDDRLVYGYTEEGKVATVDENPLLGGASGIITTLPDLMKFMRFQLESNSPVIKESIRSLFEDKEEDEHLGYLWDLGYSDKEGFYYMKSGTSNGTQSIILLCPDSDYGQILLMTNTSEKATNDWLSLYNRIEHDLIEFPKINLWSSLELQFQTDKEAASRLYQKRMTDTSTYFASSDYLNRIAYNYLFQGQTKAAIDVLNLAIACDSSNANLYDSRGEMYFAVDDYAKAKENYLLSLKFNAENTNAQAYIKKIDSLERNH